MNTMTIKQQETEYQKGYLSGFTAGFQKGFIEAVTVADESEDFDRGAPCFRIDPGGQIVQINCKTGEEIKKV